MRSNEGSADFVKPLKVQIATHSKNEMSQGVVGSLMFKMELSFLQISQKSNCTNLTPKMSSNIICSLVVASERCIEVKLG